MVATLLFLSLSLFLFIGLLPVVTFAQSDHLGVPTIAQIPSVEEQSQRGFLILTTNVINDNGGSKHAPDFIINVLGSPSFPSILQAAQTPDVQIISIQAGYYSISVNNTQGYNTSFGNQCEGQIKAGEIKTCLITVNDKGTTTPPPPPPPTGDVDAKFPELIKRANPNELVILDGSGSTGTITSWSIVQMGGQPSVVLQDVPTKPFSKQFIMPNTEDTLKFTLTVRNDQTGKQNTDTITVSKTLTTPPPPGNFPVSSITWFYDSKNALSKDMTLKSGACLEPPLSLITFVPTTRKPNSDCSSSVNGICEIVNCSPSSPLVCDGGNSNDGNDSGIIDNCGIVGTLSIVVEDSSKVIKQDFISPALI